MTSFSRLIPSGRKLLVFEAAARTGSFTAAAREFNLTQPSVSRSIAQLEDSLGMALFERGPAGLALTPEGRELHAVVHGSLERIGAVIRSLQERRKTARPVVTLSLSSSFAMHWLVPRLAAFQASFPGVDLRFDLAAGILRGIPDNVDLATRILPDQGLDCPAWDFAPEIILPVCSPAYLHRHGRLDHDGDGRGHVFLHLTDHDMAAWGRVWGGVSDRAAGGGSWLEFSDYAVILQAAMNGEGIALGWVSVIADALVRGVLVPASDCVIRTGKQHQLVRPKGRPASPVVDEIRAWMTAEMGRSLAALAQILPDFPKAPPG
ncbi:LysR substrate-binding domain-containing protein [Paracoccus denitrificans]|uniref:LysR substrate-binding domain-containing protein n=1 Tax=Paracoccus denitrificans TaxID=266 RepID=UPI000CEC3EEB|nr:LysR substrate-binding domain-containing protein [Paracoccus denitrificans]